MLRASVLLSARRWSPPSYKAMQNEIARAAFSVRSINKMSATNSNSNSGSDDTAPSAVPPSSSPTASSATSPLPPQENTTTTTTNETIPPSSTDAKNTMPPNSATTSSSKRAAKQQKTDQNASTAESSVYGITYAEFQRALKDREFASTLIQERFWKEDYAVYILCLVCVCLVFYSTSSSTRQTKRRCELLEQRTKEELDLVRSTVKSTLERWEKELVQRDERILDVHAKNVELTTAVEQMTTAIKSCSIPNLVR